MNFKNHVLFSVDKLMNCLWNIWHINSCTSNYTVNGVTYDGSPGSFVRTVITHWWAWRCDWRRSREQESSLLLISNCYSVTLLRISTTICIVTATMRLGGGTEDKLTGDTNLTWSTWDPRFDIFTLSSLLSDTGSCLVVFRLLARVVLDQTSQPSCTHSCFIGKPSTSVSILNTYQMTFSTFATNILTDGAHWRQTPHGSVCSWPDGQVWRRVSTSGHREVQ